MNILTAKALAVDEETARSSHIKKAQTKLRPRNRAHASTLTCTIFAARECVDAQTTPAISRAISTPDRSTRASGRRRALSATMGQPQ